VRHLKMLHDHRQSLRREFFSRVSCPRPDLMFEKLCGLLMSGDLASDVIPVKASPCTLSRRSRIAWSSASGESGRGMFAPAASSLRWLFAFRVVVDRLLGELARFRAFALFICKPAEFDFRQTSGRCGAGEIPIHHVRVTEAPYLRSLW
jgi:hypothetical protein